LNSKYGRPRIRWRDEWDLAAFGPSIPPPLSAAGAARGDGDRAASQRDLDWDARWEDRLFIHWGLYSALGRGEWQMYKRGDPGGKVQTPRVSPDGNEEFFDAAKFDPKQWAQLAKDAG
jgi:hypothetical protein